MKKQDRIIKFEGKEFLDTPSKQTYSSYTSIGTNEKRKINKRIAFEMQGKKCLECYSGVGLSTLLFARQCKSLTCIEKDKNAYEKLILNLKEFKNIKFYNDNNLNVLPYLVNYGYKFDLIDLDPFDNCWEQLQYIPKLLDKGILLITSGEHFGFMRRHSTLKEMKEDKTTQTRYEVKGDIKFYDFPSKILFPYIQKLFSFSKLILEHCVVSKSTSRMVISINYEISEELRSWFEERKESIGWVSRFMVKNKSLEDFEKVN